MLAKESVTWTKFNADVTIQIDAIGIREFFLDACNTQLIVPNYCQLILENRPLMRYKQFLNFVITSPKDLYQILPLKVEKFFSCWHNL
jgi:hypothetical protein